MNPRASEAGAGTQSGGQRMRVLIADDDLGSRRAIEFALSRRGYDVVACADGDSAWSALQGPNAPRLAILDWMMPGLDGVEICRRLRATDPDSSRYLVLLTARDRTDDVVEALDAGADDHMRKPFAPAELYARVRAGFRVLELQESLASRVDQLLAITDATTAYVGDGDWRRANALLLRAALKQTESGCGFSGVVVDGPVLRILAHEGVAWDPSTVREPEDNVGTDEDEGKGVGLIELRDFNNLFGRVVTSGVAVVANALAIDTRTDWKPSASPRLTAFLGVPILHGKSVIGMIGVANRPGGYTEADQERIELLASTASVLYDSYRRSQTEEVLQARFRQTEKLQAIGRLAGGIAHDFNNVLTAITGHSELLLESLNERDPIRKDLQQIKKSAERAAALTHQLLAFSRKQVLTPKILDMRNVVNEISPMLRRLIGEDIELETRLPESLSSVRADRGQIEQVIMNLVVNARDAMLNGGRITIEAADGHLGEAMLQKGISGEAGPCVVLSVIDEGCGMDANTLSHLFEPFFTTKELGRGTGLGLATTYGIVRQSNGQICVESKPGRGTRFDVYLPRVEGVEAESAVDEAGAIGQGGTERILLVEDDEGVRGLVRDVLEGEGYTVDAAHGCTEALRLWREIGASVDLVLTDVVMPEMSGEGLVRRLKEANPELKVLFMSGYTDSGVVKHGVLVPETEFIQKPFTPAGLARKVRAVLDARTARAVAG